jgi:hypothetical protein
MRVHASWLDRFHVRRPAIQGVWARKTGNARHKAIETVKTWFKAATELYLQHQYDAERVCNIDDSGFTVGESQPSKALVDVRENSSWKVISGR